MFKRTRLRRTIAIFLLANMVLYIFTPLVAYASLTGGPTAPEYTSFEPVDTTDMVNLATGDFNYNVPLLEVPGPEGGYPLSLSYHSGIATNQEASWVGLGWSLSPGAINRTVNGYADDILEKTRTRIDAWSGGERTSFSVGLGYAGVSFGLVFANDTYEGFGVGLNVGLSNGVMGGNIGFGPYGSVSGGVSVGASTRVANGLNASIGISTNFSSVSVGAGVRFTETKFDKKGNLVSNSFSLLGASISSNGLKPSMSAAGFSASQVNSNAGRVTTDSRGWSFSLPLPGNFSLSVGQNYLRYYSFESSDVKTIGALHADKSAKNPDDYAFDSYALKNPETLNAVVKEDDPEMDRGGSFPSYDSYHVTGQGVGGSIQPYIFENASLYRQNKLKSGSTTDYLIKYTRKNNFTGKVNFRFKNDFSNRLTYSESAQMTVNSGNYSFQNASKDYETEGFNTSDNHLAGSQHVEWFTNQELVNGTAVSKGFMKFTLDQDGITNDYGGLNDQIGGFMITNSSGVTYHYGLPVYSYDEYSKTFEDGDPGTYQSNSNPAPYAYNWLLTAITGPDFVDRGGLSNQGNGQLDDDDWGYWVKFDYGLWAKDYQWRNPIEGFHHDLRREHKTYSIGKKEIYYLDAVSTRSHVALFEKELRADGKGLVKNADANNLGVRTLWDTVEDPNCTDNNPFDQYEQCDEYISYSEYSTGTLKLNRVLLFQKKLLNTTVENLRDDADDYDHLFDFSDPYYYYDNKVRVHFGDNVIDKFDIAQSPGLINSALRVIEFDHNYELADETPNSFDAAGLMYALSPNTSQINNKLGKLTLKKLRFKGKKGVAVIPPIDFTYGSNPDYAQNDYDIWGMYKSGYVATTSPNVDRMVTPASAAETDAWSLTQINSSMGANIKIDYESDTYTKPVLYQSYNLNITNFSYNSSTNKTTLTLSNAVPNLNNAIGVGSQINAKFLKGDPYYHQRIFTKADGTFPSVHYSQNGFDTNVVDLLLTVDNVYFDTPSGKWKIEVPGFTLPMEANRSEQQPNPYLYQCFNNAQLDDAYCQNAVWEGTGREVYTYAYNQTPSMIAGNVSFSQDVNYLGGGIRTKSVSIDDGNTIYKTGYKYEDPSNPGISSGVTSYEPYGEDIAIYNWPNISPFNGFSNQVKENKQKVYENALRAGFHSLLAVSREVPPPGVVYEYVTVEEYVKHGTANEEKLPSKKVYQFETFNEDMVERTPLAQTGSVVDPIVIKDYTARVGNLKRIETHGKNGLLEVVENHYLHDNKTNSQFRTDLNAEYDGQGVVSQLFNEFRTIESSQGNDIDLHIFSRRDEYPAVPIGQTVHNYTTGVITEESVTGVDFYSGQPTEMLTKDGFGNLYLSESTPAYHKYPGDNTNPGMGLKIFNINNAHMLTQSAGLEMYKVEEDGSGGYTKKGLVSASAQTWTDNAHIIGGSTSSENIWRKHKGYTWVGATTNNLEDDGLYPLSGFSAFNAWGHSQSPSGTNWLKDSEFSMYDVHSHIVQVKDRNNAYSSNKRDKTWERVLASAAPARYYEFAYSGAEDNDGSGVFGGGVIANDGSVRSASTFGAPTHTGDKSLYVTASNDGFGFVSYSLSPGIHRASVWANVSSGLSIKYHSGGGAAQTATLLPVKQAGDWYLYRANINVTNGGGSNFTIYCSASQNMYMDDFRFHPIGSTMKSYVYNQWGELSHVLGPQNLYTQYKYNAAGNLIEISKERIGVGNVKKTSGEIIYEKSTN